MAARSATIWRSGLFLGWIMVAACPAPGSAQQTATPPGFDPYSAPYRSYAFPTAGTDPSLPNLQRYGSGTLGGRYGSLDEASLPPGNGDLIDSSANGVVSRYRRYDRTFRGYDHMLGRDVRPNSEADARYFADRQKREELQLKAMRELDPKKRADILRQIQAESGRDEVSPYMSYRRGSSPAAAATTTTRGSAATAAPASSPAASSSTITLPGPPGSR